MSNYEVSKQGVLVNGVDVEFPNHLLKEGRRLTTTIVDGKIFINGYEYKNGKWKRTLRALYHHIF